MEGRDGRNYTLGRGELHFDQYAPGTQTLTGERYLGNTPEFTTTSESEELEHFDSDHGVNDKDDSVTLSNTSSGSFTTDNINTENVAMFYLGSTQSLAQLAQAAVIDAARPVLRGRTYQLGTSAQRPAGVRNVNNVQIRKGAAPGTEVALTNNVEVDLDLGRIYIESDAPDIADGDLLTFTYDLVASTNTQIVSGTKEIEGALRFIAFNPKGGNRDYYWPRTKLSPNGDFALKSGDDWQTIPFNVEFLRKGSLEKVYINSRGVAVTTP
jgi:hypothetical protein